MNTFSKIRRGACVVLLLTTTLLLVVWRAQSPSGERTFSNVGNTMANVGGGGSYGSSYQARPESNSDNLWCLAIGFSFGIFVTLMVTELLTKFEQAFNDLALLRMKYEALCRERLAEAPPSADRCEPATAGK